VKTNYKKVFRELRIYQGRTAMALVGILIGITSIGFVLTTFSILTREMDVNYMNTNPSSIVLKVSNLDARGVNLVKEMQDNTSVEVRKTLSARINRENGTYGTIYLFAVENFKNLKLDTFHLEKGALPASSDQMVLERDSLKNLTFLKKGYGERVAVKLPGGTEANINLSGIVHAPGLSPASMEKYSYAFLTLEALQNLGYSGWYDEIHLVAYDSRFDREKLRRLAADMKEQLMQNGYQVAKVDVPVPGKHPHGDQLKSLLFLLQAFAVISLFVACIIIINLLNFIMSTQTKQIAIMKSYGASTLDIALPYFLYVLLISIAAILISIPISIFVGSGYSDFAAGVLNFEITSYRIPSWVTVVEVTAGILIPLISAFYPIYRSCKITVKEGLSEQSSTGKAMKTPSLLRRRISRTNTKIRIPLNNVFRKKGRSILAILALATGGVLFMTSQNIVASIDRTVDVSMDTFSYDFDVRLCGQYPDEELLNKLSNIDGVKEAEIYKANTAVFQKDDGTESAFYTIKALPIDSSMIRFNLLKGSNIETSGPAVIINKALWDEEKWMQPGMTVTMKVGDQSTSVVIAGIVKEVPPLPSIYINLDTYEAIFSQSSRQNILFSVKDLTLDEQVELSKKLEADFAAEGIEISENWNISLLRKAFVEHLNVIVNFLSVVALLAVVVGGLSIASAIGINITERKRELGIQRAIGVNSRQIITMISSEVILMGVAGWLLGVVLAYPISIWTGNYFGQIFLHTDLNNTISFIGAIRWLVISIIVAFLSGLIPAWKAAGSSLKEMLAYE
jgi:putative ABC transport system permease protein